MSQSQTIWIDTNIIIYYLRTNKDHTPVATALINAANEGQFVLKISPLVIAECVFVLMGRDYGCDKNTIKTLLLSFINMAGVEMEEKNVVEEALKNYAKRGIDFTDAYLAAHAKSVKPAHIVTVNIRDFQKLDILAQLPGDLVVVHHPE